MKKYYKRVIIFGIRVFAIAIFFLVSYNCPRASEKTMKGVIMEKNLRTKEIWINIGRSSGIKKGQPFDVYRKGVRVAALKVTEIFDSFSRSSAVSDKDIDEVEVLDEVEFGLIPDNSGISSREISMPNGKTKEVFTYEACREKMNDEFLAKEEEIVGIKRELGLLRKQVVNKNNELEEAYRMLSVSKEQLKREEKIREKLSKSLKEIRNTLKLLRTE